MTSVVTARSGIAARAAASRSRYRRTRVAAAHGGEHAVAPGLERQVELLTNRPGLGHRGDRLRAEVLGVRAREPDPADPLDRADRPQQIGEERPRRAARVVGPRRAGEARLVEVAPGRVPQPEREVSAVGVHVLAEEGHLGRAACARAPAPRRRARRTGRLCSGPRTDGHDAEGTGVVAADLDRHPRRVRQIRIGRAAPRRRRRRRRSAPRGSRPPGGRGVAPRRAGRPARPTLWVPKTAATWGARARIASRSFCARQPPTAIWRPGRRSASDFSCPR